MFKVFFLGYRKVQKSPTAKIAVSYREAIFLILFVLFISLGCSRGAEPRNEDNLTLKAEEEPVDPNAWDFGRAKEGKVLKHTFTLKNESSKTVNIIDVNTSCGCTVSEVKKKTLAPQESTPLEVKFDTEGYSGRVKQYIYVHTDDLDNLVVRFIIKADLENRDGSEVKAKVSLLEGTL